MGWSSRTPAAPTAAAAWSDLERAMAMSKHIADLEFEQLQHENNRLKVTIRAFTDDYDKSATTVRTDHTNQTQLSQHRLSTQLKCKEVELAKQQRELSSQSAEIVSLKTRIKQLELTSLANIKTIEESKSERRRLEQANRDLKTELSFKQRSSTLSGRGSVPLAASVRVQATEGRRHKRRFHTELR